MSAFDRAVANAGIEIQPKKLEQPEIEGTQDTSFISGMLGTLENIFGKWGANVQRTYDTSPMYEGFRGAGDAWENTDFTNPANYHDNNTFAGSFANAAIGNAAGVVGGVADLIGLDKLGNKMHDVVKGTQDQNEIEPGFNMNYITSPHGLTRSVGDVFGSIAAIAPVAALVPESAAAAGATRALQVASKLGGNKGMQYLIDSGYPQVAKWIGDRMSSYLPSAVRWGISSGPVEAMAEGGGVVRTAKENNLDNPYGRGWATAAENLPLLLASNTLEGMVFRGGFRPGYGASALRRAASVPIATGIESGQNATEEAAQQIIQNLNTDRPLTEGVERAAKEGGFGSLPFGFFPGVYHAVRNQPTINDSQEYRDWYQGAAPGQSYDNVQLPTNRPVPQSANNNSTQPPAPPLAGSSGNLSADQTEAMQKLLDQLFADQYNQQEQFAGAPSAPQAAPAPQGGSVSFDRLDTDIDAGGVSIDGAQPETIGMINRAKQIYKEMFGRDDFWVSAVTGGHAEGTPHALGYKADVGGSALEESRENRIRFQQALQAEGIGANNEYDMPSENSTGGHFDLDSRGKNWQTGEEFGGFKGGAGNVGATTSAPQQADSATEADLSRFSDKQLEAWREAQWVESQTGIPAEFVYKQWAFESDDFTSPNARYNNNFGGLTQSEPNGEENKQPDGNNYYRVYKDFHDYAESYVRDFINLYQGKDDPNNYKTLRDFIYWLKSEEYFGADPEEYLAGVESKEVPTSRNTGSRGRSTSGQSTPSKPTDTSDPEMDRMYEEFAKTWMREGGEEERNVFEGMFTKNGKFIDNEENRRIIDEEYGEEFKQFADEEKNPSVQRQMDRLIDEAVQMKDFDRLQALQTAKQSGDISAMRSFLDEARAKQVQTEPQPLQQTQQEQPAQSNIQAIEGQQVAGRLPQVEQTGGNINGNENTEGTQTQPAQGENATNQNQNAEPGQGQAAEGQGEVSQPVQQEEPQAQQPAAGYTNTTVTTRKGEERPAVTWEGRVDKDEWNRRAEIAKQNGGWWYPKSKAFGFKTEENRDAFLQAINAPAQSEATSTPVYESAGLRKFREVAKDFIEQYKADKITYSKALQGINKARSLAKRAVRISAEQDIEDAYKVAMNELSRIRAEKENQPAREAASQDESLEESSRTTSEPVQQKESKALSQLKKNAEKIVKDYRADESTYDEAWRKVVSVQESAERVAPDSDTREAIQDVARGALMELENIYQEKNGHEIGETPSQTAQKAAGEQENTAQAEEPMQEEKSAQSDNVEKYINERHKDNADEIRKKLHEETTLWDDEAQMHKRTTMAQFLEDFAKTPGARVYYKPPQKTDGISVAGDIGEYVYQNDRMKADNYEPTLSPIYYDYAKYLLNQNKGQSAQSEAEPASNEGGEKSAQALKKFGQEANRIIQEYKANEISFVNAANQIRKARSSAENAAPDAETKKAIEQKAREEEQELVRIDTGRRERGENTLPKIKSKEESAKKPNFDNIVDETKGEPKQDKPLPVSYAERKSEIKKAFESAAHKGDMSGTVEAVQSYVNRMVSAMKSDMDKLANRPDLGVDLDTYLTGFDSFANMIDDVMTPGALSVFNGDQKRQIKGRVRDAVEAARGELKKYKNTLSKQEKPAEAENNTVKAGVEYKYYMNQRPVSPGAQPRGFTRFDEEDKGGRYGAIYYDHPLTEQEIADYELTPAKEESSNEQQGESSRPDGGHGDMEPGGGREDQREGAGEVSGRDGREGETDGRDDGQEHSEESQPAGVRAGTELEEATGQGVDKRGNQPEIPLTEAEAHPSPTETPGHNYEIKDTNQSTKSEKVRFKQNVEAIKMLKQLEADDRMPTPAEQEILAGYNGWGGLKGAFIEGSDMNKEIRELLTEEEYKVARSTINDAFYTPPKLIRAIWEGISHLGFKGGRVLDPSMGVGNFFGTMPRDMMEKSILRGVELDDLTSRLGRMLYPGAFVEHKGFQKSAAADNYFDLAISNIPFGQNMIDGYQVHNFFFANGIDKVRPGGLMVYITSQGSLAGGKDAVKMRNYLSGQADLIAAYKLPSGVFSDAGTQVATDIVVFRKRDKDGKKSPYGQKFADVKEVKSEQGYYAQKLYDINEYFEAHPENILGEQSSGRDQWGNPALNVKMAEGASLADVASNLETAMKKLPEDVYQPVSRRKSKAFDTASAQKRAAVAEKTRDYEYYYKDGKPVQNQNGQEVEITGAKAKIVDSYLKLKGTLNALFAAESDPKATNKQVESLRKKLNKDYDTFVAKHGLLTGKAAAAFRDDPSAGMVQALEKPKEETYKDKKGNERKRIVGAEKADIFSVRSIKPVQEVTHVESADDALIASLTNRGGVDLDYMAGLMNSKPEKLVPQLKGKVFRNPVTEDYETREEYLSGNVREKLAQAQEAAKSDKAYADNVKELEKVVPEDLVSDEIYVNLGTPWIPVSDVQDFVNSITDGLTVKFSRGAALWNVTGWGRSAKYKLQGMNLAELLDHVLNNKAIQIYDGTGDNKVFNKEKTDAANVAADELQQEFRDWIWKDKEREKRLVRYYNDNFNNTVVRQYNGQHLNLHDYGMNAKITLKPHQKDVVWRMLQGQNTLVAHCVGAGKTFEMQAAGMEMRRLGIANKPMYCLPNNVVQQFAREFRILYPNAKLLVLQSNDLPAVEKTSKLVKTEDGRTKRESLLEGKTPEQKAAIMAKRTARNRMLNRIRTEDWDGIIISHNLFQRFPVTPDTAAAFIQQEIDNLEQTIREARADRSMDTRALSNMENAKKNLEERLEDAISTDIEDIGVPFEELGVDQLFVDEADMFKNLEFATRLGNIRGLSNSKANRSRDMFIKTQWLTNTLNGRGVVFATGTPVSNTMSELYTMMRYLDMKGLKEKGLELFDNWLRTFGDIGQGIERKPTGDGFRKVTMIKRFINMAELTKMFRKFADVKVQEELNLDIPKLKDGKSTVVALDPDPGVVNYIKNVVPERVKKMKSGFKKEKGEDNMLSLTNDLRKLSLTDSKIEACADAIVKKYRETTDVMGTQLVFCDMGIPKAEKGETALTDKDGEAVAAIENPEVYRKLIEKLKEKGIPDKDIAFIQNYNTKQKRDGVFQKVNNGEVRILIGSTETMGAGTNCQKHLVALHDLDAPWRPRDLEQRHGRILRQGNDNKEVEIFNYVVKDSFDANMWEKLKNKAAIIQQAMSGDMNMRTVEDADLVTLSYAEVEGAATGNPLIKEQLQVQNDLTKYQHAQTAFRRKVRDAENLLDGADERVDKRKQEIARAEKDIAQRKDTKGDKFSMLVGKTGYKERGKADEALSKLLENLSKRNPVEIGQIGGFRLMGYHNGVEPKLFLMKNLSYDVNKNSVQGIEYVLNHAPDTELEYLSAGLERMEKDIAQAEEIVKQENPYAEKVKALSDRLNQLNREIAETLVDDGKQAAETAPKEEAEEEKTSSNRKYSLDNSDTLAYNERRALDKIKDDMSFGEARELFLEERNRKLAAALNVFERAYEASKTVTDRIKKLFEPVLEARNDANQTRDEYTTKENIRNLERLLRNRGLLGEGSYLAGDIQRVLNSLGAEGDNGSVARIPGEYERMYRKIEKYEKSGKFPIPKGHSIRQGAFSNARSMEELKAETIEAFPGAKVQESGNKLTFTMPNGQKVTFTFHESITVSDEELSRAKREHGIDQRVTVTVEGYAEAVDGEGFGALSQVSRKGTGFHEAYHIAEAIAFTKKELADAKRLISANEEERANAYAKWKLERKKHSNFAKLWQKIADVAAKMAGILGYETKRNIFRKVESGEIYQRDNTAGNLSRKYSINASDNSKESLIHRAKNFFSKSRAADTPEYRRMLKGMMEEIAGIKIRYGKMSEDSMEAVYDSFKKVIRAKSANDWENVLPLFAKATCEKLGIKPSDKLSAYISDWIQTGAPNNNSAEAETFAKAMREHPEIGDQLIDLQEAFQRWDKMNAMERGQNIISWQNQEKTTLTDMLNTAYDQLVEELGPVKRLVKAVEKQHGRIRNALNPYVAFRLFRGHYGRAMVMVEGNHKAITDIMAREYPNLDWTGFKTIHEILNSVGGLHNEKVRKEFETYCLACHVYDIHKANDLTTMEIERLSGELANASEEEQEEIKQKIEKLNKTILDTPLSRTDCGEIIRRHQQKYGRAQQDLVHYSNMTLAILKDSGMISERRYNNILKKWPNYVPMFRVFDDNGNVQFGDSMKAMMGSRRDVIEPLQSIIRNTFDFIRKAEKNKAKCLLANLAQMSDVGKYIDPVDNARPDDKTTITYYVGGQKRYLQTDPAVVAAVNGMGKDQSTLLMKILRFPAQIARSAFTVSNPAFLIRNATRDMQDAFVYNDRGIIFPTDFVRAFMHAFRKDDVYWEWMASGAAQSSAISIDRNYAQATIDKMTKSKKDRIKHPLDFIRDALERLAEFSELGTRIAAYERTKKALAKGDMAKLTALDLAEAAYESRDLMDFARGGKASRQWNSLAIFANASIQGWDKFFRTFNFKDDPKAAMRATARLAIAGMLPALVLTLINWDKDWWKEIPDWQKDTHWILAPNIRIPKGQDIGIRFMSSFIEKGLDSMYNKNPMTAKRVMKPVYEQTPDILPTALLPVIEAMTNYSFFKEAPIVPQYQKDLPQKLQYSGLTSGLAKALGEVLDYSPRKIDHIIQGYTGSIGKGVVSGIDIARGERRMNTALEEMPVLNGFMMTPYKNSATVDKFYEEYRKQVEGDKAFKATKERMEGYSPAKYKRMTQANKKMSELNKKERKLLDDNNISPARKQELQAGIQQKRIAIAKGALER